jgi:hypothetical protein
MDPSYAVPRSARARTRNQPGAAFHGSSCGAGSADLDVPRGAAGPVSADLLMVSNRNDRARSGKGLSLNSVLLLVSYITALPTIGRDSDAGDLRASQSELIVDLGPDVVFLTVSDHLDHRGCDTTSRPLFIISHSGPAGYFARGQEHRTDQKAHQMQASRIFNGATVARGQ